MRRSVLRLAALPVLALVLGGCSFSSQGIELASDDPDYEGALLFQQRCAACHTLDAAGGEGSAVNANGREYKDGPNFNVRAEQKDQVLYAIRNGGYSSGPMPQNLVVGEEAEKVADFVSKYAGKEGSVPVSPDQEPPEGTQSDEQ